jgi:alkylation response protein AidB-like acyl-CoA dehydrogenase
VIEAISEADGSSGWSLMIGVETLGITSGQVGPWGADLYADPRVTMAGALNPLGRARVVEGGFQVSGRWPYGSGCKHAKWFLGGSLLLDDEGQSLHTSREMIIPAEQFEILDTWEVAGLRGSGSHDVVVNDVFVPLEHTTATLFEPSRRSGTLFRYPMMPRLAYNKVGVATGIARAAINHFVELANAKTPVGARSTLRERVSAQEAVAKAEWLLEAGRAYLVQVIRETWSAIGEGGGLPMEQRARLRLASSGAVAAATKAVELVYAAGGASVNYTRSPLERCFRDIHVVPAHITVSPQMTEAAGRVLLGLDPGLATF